LPYWRCFVQGLVHGRKLVVQAFDLLVPAPVSLTLVVTTMAPVTVRHIAEAQRQVRPTRIRLAVAHNGRVHFLAT
jgi:hypothetical protein